jgi:hypothetical protein
MTKVDEGTSLQFDFQGDSIAWHSRTFPQGGVAYVSVDGGAIETVDTSSSTSRPNNDDAVVWTKAGLDPKINHRVVIRFDTPTTPARLRIRADDATSTTGTTTSGTTDGGKPEATGTSQATEAASSTSVAATESSSSPTQSPSEQSSSPTPGSSTQPLPTTATTSVADPIVSVKAEPAPPGPPGAQPIALPAGGPPQPGPPGRPGRPGPPGTGEGPGRPRPGEGPGRGPPLAGPRPPAAPPAPPAPAPASPPAPPAAPAAPQQPQPATPAPAPPVAEPQSPAQPPAQPATQQAPQTPAQPPAGAVPVPPARDPVVQLQPGNTGVVNPNSPAQAAPIPLAPVASGILTGGPNRFISVKQFIVTIPDDVAKASPADPSSGNNFAGDSPQGSSQDPSVNMAAVGGGIGAGVVLLALLGGFFYFERRKKLQRQRDSDPFAGTDPSESKWRQLPDDVEAQRYSGPSITVSPPGVGRRTTIIHRSEVVSQHPSLGSRGPSIAITESVVSGQPSSLADAPPEEFLEKSEIEAYNYRWSLFTAPPAGTLTQATTGRRPDSQ